MSQSIPNDPDFRVLVLATRGRDAPLLCERIRETGIASDVCEDMEHLCHEIGIGAGLAVAAAETLWGESLAILAETLRQQPTWSDFPLIVMTSGGEADRNTMRIMRAIEGLAHATLLERPIRTLTFISSVKVALQSRRRQYQVRDYLAERMDAEKNLIVRSQLAALRADVALTLARPGPLKDVLHRCCQALVEHVGAAFARIWTLDSTNQELRLQASAGMYSHLNGAHGTIKLGEFKIGRIAASREPLLTNDVQTDINISDPDWARSEGMVSFAGYPLVVEDHVVGVIGMFARERLSEVVLEELGPLADGIAQCIQRKRTELALEQSQSQFRLLLDSTAEAIYGLDEHGNCTFCNPACVALLGYESTDDLIGRNMHVLIHHTHADDRPYPQEECLIYQAYREQRGVHVDNEVLWRANGTSFAAEYWSYPMFNDGQIVGAVVTFIDITERRESERKLKLRNRALQTINRINVSIAAQLSIDKLVQEVTTAGTELTGAQFGAFFYNVIDDEGESYMLYGLAGVPRTTFEKLPMPRKTEIFAATFSGKSIVRLDDVTLDPRYGTNAPYFGLPDGHLPVRSYLAVPVASGSGEVIGGLFFGHEDVGVFNEYSEHILSGIAAQAAVAIDNARLFENAQRELMERRRVEDELRSARIAAEAANESKSQFLANMSHEIRTPMTAILGYADIMLRNLRDPDNVECVTTIKRNGKFLLELINDILDLSKIEAGKLKADKKRFDLLETLADIHRLMLVRAQEKQLPLSIEYDGMLPVSIESDPVRLRQILVNLIGNAIKFTENGSVVLRVHLVNGGDSGKIRFDVVDTGIGMADDTISQLFEPFMQADLSDTRRYSGTGLGLAISRRLARILGGDITVVSKLGQGATFSVTVSVGSLIGVDIADVNGVAITSNRVEEITVDDLRLDCKILVVDDRRDIRYLAQHFLEEAGGTVVVAEDGQEAIDKVLNAEASQPFDIIVLDMQMPIMDGYAATRRLRSHGYRRPIIALTAGAMQGDREKCIEAGCDDYTSKPIDGPKLVELVSRHLVRNRG